VLEKLGFCKEEVRTVEIPAAGCDLESYSCPPPLPEDMTGYVHRALVTGIRDFFAKGGMKKAIVGLSGELTPLSIIAAEAWERKNLALLMPRSSLNSRLRPSQARTWCTNG